VRRSAACPSCAPQFLASPWPCLGPRGSRTPSWPRPSTRWRPRGGGYSRILPLLFTLPSQLLQSTGKAFLACHGPCAAAPSSFIYVLYSVETLQNFFSFLQGMRKEFQVARAWSEAQRGPCWRGRAGDGRDAHHSAHPGGEAGVGGGGSVPRVPRRRSRGSACASPRTAWRRSLLTLPAAGASCATSRCAFCAFFLPFFS